jgi:hypothetical protein
MAAGFNGRKAQSSGKGSAMTAAALARNANSSSGAREIMLQSTRTGFALLNQPERRSQSL